MIYLDYAATTPVCPAAAQAAVKAMTEDWGNPSSQYPFGKDAAKRREEHRAVVAGALGCQPAELFFTSCGTEGDNWAIRAAVELGRKKGNHIVTTAIEHSAVLEPIKALEKEGFAVTWLKPDRWGNIDTEQVKSAIRPDTVLVSMMLVNNEIGSILPVEAAADAIQEKGAPALLHTDAVQAFLKLPFTPEGLGADFVNVSGHKIGAPKGVGALYIKKSLIPKVKEKPLMLGGGQENGLRPGTEATAQTAAFAAAVQAWEPEAVDRIRRVRAHAAQALGAVDGVEVLSGAGGAPHILAVSVPLFSGETLVRVLGDKGFCLSSGSACHRGKPSHVFEAMPLPEKVKYGALRLSFGPASTVDEVDQLAQVLEKMCARKSLLV